MVIDLRDEPQPEPEPQPDWKARLRSAIPAGSPHATWRVRTRQALAAATLAPRLAGRFTPARSLGLAAAWSVAVLLAATIVVDLLVVTTSAGSQIVWWDRFLSLWRAGHLMPVRTSDGLMGLLPMAGAILVLAVGRRASAWLWSAVEGRTPRPAKWLAALGATTFAVTLLIACLPPVGQVQGSALAGIVALAGLAAGPPLHVLARRTLRRDRPRVWTILRTAATILVLLGAASLALLLLSTVLSLSQLQSASTSLLSGTAATSTWRDAVALVLLQLAYLPNLVVWGAAYLLGAGFAVGAGTVVSPFTVEVGSLPQVPVVALLPEHGLSMALLPPFLVAVLAAIGGHVMRGIADDLPIRGRAALAGMVTTVVAAVLVVLAFVSGGSLGPGRLDRIGPSPLSMALACVVVVGAGLLFWAVLPTVVADLRPHVSAASRRLAARLQARRETRSGPDRGTEPAEAPPTMLG